MRRRGLRAHRDAASTPPTLAEAWAAVLDNPKWVHRLANEVGGGEDAIADAQIAVVAWFMGDNPGNAYTKARWRLIATHAFSGRVLDVPVGRVSFKQRWDAEAERRRNLGLPPMAFSSADRAPKDGVTWLLLDGAWRVDIEPRSTGVFYWVNGEWIPFEEMVGVDPVEREDLFSGAFRAAWGRLGPKEQAIVQAVVVEERRLRDIGLDYGVSKQRIGEIVRRSLAKLARWMRPTQVDGRDGIG